MNSFLSDEELSSIGLGSVGNNVLISRKASIYGASFIHIGDNVRVDDFCVLSAGAGGISIGNRIHIAVFSSIIGKGNVEIDDYANISSRVSIYSSSDDYSGEWMTNPMVPEDLTNVDHSSVKIGKHCIIGSGCVVLPGSTLNEGAAIGALSLVRSNCEAFGIYAGVPAKRVAERKRRILVLEKQVYLAEGD